MITDLLQHIANEIIASNTFLDKICPIAFKLRDNSVVGYTTESEFEYVGISDQNNRAGYIRYESEIQYTNVNRTFSSSNKFKQATVTGTLVVFSFSHDKFNPIMLGQKLSDNLQNISFASYFGGENSIKINVKRVNTDPLKVYANETGRTYDGGTGYSAASVQFDLTYTTSEDRCVSDCDIFQKYINCDIIPSEAKINKPNQPKTLTCENINECESFNDLLGRVEELENKTEFTCETLSGCELIQTIQQAIAETNSLLSTHANDQNNPHNVTAGQVGAPTIAEAQTMADQAEQDAKNYADSQDALVLSAANTNAQNYANIAETNSNAYTDAEILNLSNDPRFSDARNRKIFSYSNINASHTGSTVVTILKAIPLPLMGANDNIDIVSHFVSSGVGTKNFRAYLTLSPISLAGAILIGGVDHSSSSNRISRFRRSIVNKNSVSVNSIYNNAVTVPNDENFNNTSSLPTVLNLDLSTQYYCVFAVTLSNAGGIGTCADTQSYFNQA